MIGFAFFFAILFWAVASSYALGWQINSWERAEYELEASRRFHAAIREDFRRGLLYTSRNAK